MNGGLYKLPNGQLVHGNCKNIETNPKPGEPTMSEKQYNEFVNFVLNGFKDE